MKITKNLLRQVIQEVLSADAQAAVDTNLEKIFNEPDKQKAQKANSLINNILTFINSTDPNMKLTSDEDIAAAINAKGMPDNDTLSTASKYNDPNDKNLNNRILNIVSQLKKPQKT